MSKKDSNGNNNSKGQGFKFRPVSFYNLSSEPFCYTAYQFPLVSALLVPFHLLKSFLQWCNKVTVFPICALWIKTWLVQNHYLNRRVWKEGAHVSRVEQEKTGECQKKKKCSFFLKEWDMFLFLLANCEVIPNNKLKYFSKCRSLKGLNWRWQHFLIF